MPNILTPLSLFNNFKADLDLTAGTVDQTETDGIVIERVTYLGRETRDGRVRIASAFAYDKSATKSETVLIFPDSSDTIDTELLKLFVRRGYSALMVDYRGKWEGCDFYTQYPNSIEYANTAKCGRRKDFVDDRANKTSWYEWVAVGLYARKYILERTGSVRIAVVGIRDGGEIAWKLCVAEKFSALIPVCAAGWKAYQGISKYLQVEPELSEERYRFIAGVDSQAYAPYVKCPVLMLCSTNDAGFDYDRAYDTFSRINPKFADESAIAYSVTCNAALGPESTTDMFMFLDKNLKKRKVFIPKPAEVTVEADKEFNLIAKVNFDSEGIADECKVFLAEDCINPVLRDWTECPQKSRISDNEQDFYLNIYKKTSTVFVFCVAKYSNGFSVWSKTAVKKISGTFKNMTDKCRILYSNFTGEDGFFLSDPKTYALGGVFFDDYESMPKRVPKAKGVSGLYAKGGLATYRINNPRFAPSDGSLLSLDLYCDETAKVTLKFKNFTTGEEFLCQVTVTGGVWQSMLFESKHFKTANGVPMPSFVTEAEFSIVCDVDYAINNVMWL